MSGTGASHVQERSRNASIPAGMLNTAMREAISAASRAQQPFGATLLDTTTMSMVSGAYTTQDAGSGFAHAEMNVLKTALRNTRELADYVLVTTAEPCPMCAAAATISGVQGIVFGTSLEQLEELGYSQIRIRAAEVAAASMHTSPPVVHGGFLASETDQLYRDFRPTPTAADQEASQTIWKLKFPFERPTPTEPSLILAQARAGCPVAQMELPSGNVVWLITRYNDVKKALSDPRFSCAEAAKPSAPHFVPFVQLCPSLFSIDPPEHTIARRILAHGLNPGFVQRMKPVVERIIETTFSETLTASPPIDFKKVVNAPFAERIMAELLGVETEVVHGIRAHLDAAISINQLDDDEIAYRWSRLEADVVGLLNRKLADPGDDLLSTIALENRCQNAMNEAQITGLVLTLLTAGVLTPIAQITNGLATLLRHRDQYERLVQDPSLIPLAVEEVLRFNSTVEIDHLRVLTDDVELAGVEMPAGSGVFTSITSANRDSERFSAPDDFNALRSPNPHIAFGYGPHACPAAPFSRMFLIAFYTALVRQFPDLRLATSFEDLRRRGPGLHSVEIEQLLITWSTELPEPRQP